MNIVIFTGELPDDIPEMSEDEDSDESDDDQQRSSEDQQATIQGQESFEATATGSMISSNISARELGSDAEDQAPKTSRSRSMAKYF